MKICNDCKQEKDDSEFHKNQKVCKVCKNTRYKKYYAENHATMLDKNHRRRDKFRKIISEIKSELSCVECGESHEAVLDFHHTNPDEKDFSIGDYAANRYPNEDNIRILKEEIDKCLVLCANCHRKLHWYESHKKE